MSPQSTAETAELMCRHDLEPSSIFEERESAVRSYCRSFPALFTSARGALLHDADGRSYIAGDGVTHALDLHTAAKERFLREFTTRILATATATCLS